MRGRADICGRESLDLAAQVDLVRSEAVHKVCTGQGPLKTVPLWPGESMPPEQRDGCNGVVMHQWSRRS